ncbi:MAG TPA: helix-turn-helix transcriptional regulator [Lactobacillaceae bacterium]|jgi:transcriptional regulator with XRE-family HTH domain
MTEDLSLGEKLLQFRKENNVTQEELAEYLFVTRQAVSSWERNVTTPDWNTLEKISARFGIAMEVLVGQRRAVPTKKEDLQMADAKEYDKYAEEYQDYLKSKFAQYAGTKYDVAIGVFYGAALFLGVIVTLVLGFYATPAHTWADWGIAALFGGLSFLFIGLLSHGVITLFSKENGR